MCSTVESSKGIALNPQCISCNKDSTKMEMPMLLTRRLQCH